jgi:ABC-type lipoprotein export system ATPase subunit
MKEVDNNIMLELEDLWKIYKNGDEVIHSLVNLNIAFKKGSLYIIHGPSGSGKSTLIRTIGLLEKITMGKIFIKGIDTSDLSQEKKNLLIKKEIGFVFRGPNLIPTLNAVENLTLPMFNSDKEQAKKLLKLVGFTDYKRFPNDMSKEEEIRVSIARAMVNSHSIILADELTGDLHKSDADMIMQLLLELNRSENLTIIVTTNNTKLSKYSSLIEMEDGSLLNLKD